MEGKVTTPLGDQAAANPAQSPPHPSLGYWSVFDFVNGPLVLPDSSSVSLTDRLLWQMMCRARARTTVLAPH